jgi:hypothetical protein
MRRYMLLAVAVWAGLLPMRIGYCSGDSTGDPPVADLSTDVRAERFEPNTYVPYKDLAHLIDPTDQAVLMDRGEFEALLTAAEVNAGGTDSLEP